MKELSTLRECNILNSHLFVYTYITRKLVNVNNDFRAWEYLSPQYLRNIVGALDLTVWYAYHRCTYVNFKEL